MSEDGVRQISVDEINALAIRVLTSLGTAAESAAEIAESLIEADRMGHASHGVIRLLEYARAAAAGNILTAEIPQVDAEQGASATVDGRWGWGQAAAELAVRTAADLAHHSGIGIVSVRRCNHVGRLGRWVEQLAARDLIGLGFLSCGPAVAPLGGRDRVLGTNPVAIAVPTGVADQPMVLDLATSAVAEGKLRVARREGRGVPEGLIQTAAGEPTTDPEDFYSGGTILPFGGHKGFVLSVIIQVLGEALTNLDQVEPKRRGSANGLVLLAIDPSFMRPLSDFTAAVDSTGERIRNSRPITEDGRILLPGDVERSTASNSPDGRIVLPAGLWADLQGLADRVASQAAPG